MFVSGISYNTERTHQGKSVGRTPFDTLVDGKQLWQAKYLS